MEWFEIIMLIIIGITFIGATISFLITEVRTKTMIFWCFVCIFELIILVSVSLEGLIK